MKPLRATVKRDLSLISVEAWKRGYDAWNLPATFVFDGARVNFYHLQTDFDRFKTEITPSIIRDDAFFVAKNAQFLADVAALKAFDLHPWTLRQCTDLIGRIMSFYIFVVSDKFVEAKPEAWVSREASEGILYEVDEAIRKMISRFLVVLGYAPEWSRVLMIDEALEMFKTYRLHNRDEIATRLDGYILHENALTTGGTFDEFCENHEWINPDAVRPPDSSSTGGEISANEVQGTVAFAGSVRGKVVIVRDGYDSMQVEAGDILVTAMTNITWLPAMLRCAAIVTDEGGITCHAAITARELEKPCITGTKNATSVFKTGDVVEIDGATGVVKITC